MKVKVCGALVVGGVRDIVVVVVVSGDSFDCSKLLNRVEPITQTKPDQTRGKEEKKKREKGEKEKKEKREKREKKEKKEEKGKMRKGIKRI